MMGVRDGAAGAEPATRGNVARNRSYVSVAGLCVCHAGETNGTADATVGRRSVARVWMTGETGEPGTLRRCRVFRRLWVNVARLRDTVERAARGYAQSVIGENYTYRPGRAHRAAGVLAWRIIPRPIAGRRVR
jgi:hypothetical protein